MPAPRGSGRSHAEHRLVAVAVDGRPMPPRWVQIRCTRASPIPRPPGASPLGREARARTASRGRSRATPGPLSLTSTHSPRSRARRRDRRSSSRTVGLPASRQASTALSTRLPTTVTRSAETSGGRSRQVGGLLERERHPCLVGHARLGHHEGGDRGVGDARGHVADELLPTPGHVTDHGDHLVVLLELDEPGDGVELVGELVGLGAQRVGQRQVGAQLVLHRHQLGPVAHGGDRTDPLAPAGGSALVEHQDPRPDHEHRVLGLVPGQQQLPPPRRAAPPRTPGVPPRRCRQPSSSRAESLIIVTRPSVPTAMTPSRMLEMQRLAVVGQGRDLAGSQPARAPTRPSARRARSRRRPAARPARGRAAGPARRG